MKAASTDGFPNSDTFSLRANNVRKGVNKGCDTRFTALLAERCSMLTAEGKDRPERLEGKTRGATGSAVSA